MAFEPLQTDEKLDRPVKAQADMDSVMLMGCSGFVISSIGVYALSIWAFIARQEAETLVQLATSVGIGLIPSSIMGILMTRKFGLAAGCGYVGGAAATAIFLFLRVQQAFLAGRAQQAPMPDYPAAVTWLLPLGWLVLALIIAIASLPRKEFQETDRS